MSNMALLGAYAGQDNSALMFRNLLVNGNCAIDQRNSGANQTITAAAAYAYTVDRWYAYSSGGNPVGARVAASGAYQFTGAASVTEIGFAQRIEAANSRHLAGGSATFSVDLSNSLLTTVTWTAFYANTTDAFGTRAALTRTQIATGTFTVSSTLSRYTATFSVPSAATTGIEIVLSVGAQTSGTWRIDNAMLEAGASATPFERRPIGVELGMAQRYTWVQEVKSNNIYSVGYRGFGAAFVQFSVRPPVPMRSVPVLTSATNYSIRASSDGTIVSNKSATIQADSTVDNFTLRISDASITTDAFYGISGTNLSVTQYSIFSAEL